MLNLRISKSTNFDTSRLQQSSDASKIITLFVTRWLQALTISYLIGSFEIMMMPEDMFFSARLWQIYSTVVLICALKTKEILRFSGVIKT